MAGKIVTTKEKKANKKRNPTSVLRRNARERDRIRTVNDAFDHLRDHVPNGDAPKGRKISKVETLKSAIEYIHALKSILGNDSSPLGDDFAGLDNLSDSEFAESGSPESGLGSNETSIDESSPESTTDGVELNIETAKFDYPAVFPSPEDMSQLSPSAGSGTNNSLPDPISFDNYEFNSLVMQNCHNFADFVPHEQFDICYK